MGMHCNYSPPVPTNLVMPLPVFIYHCQNPNNISLLDLKENYIMLGLKPPNNFKTVNVIVAINILRIGCIS